MREHFQPCFVALLKQDHVELERLVSSIPTIADINEQHPTHGHTLLTFATTLKHLSVEMLDILLRHGAKVNATNKSGRTPLSYAAESGNKNTLKFLLEKGADPFITDDFGQTAYNYAKENGCFPLLLTQFSAFISSQMESPSPSRSRIWEATAAVISSGDTKKETSSTKTAKAPSPTTTVLENARRMLLGVEPPLRSTLFQTGHKEKATQIANLCNYGLRHVDVTVKKLEQSDWSTKCLMDYITIISSLNFLDHRLPSTTNPEQRENLILNPALRVILAEGNGLMTMLEDGRETFPHLIEKGILAKFLTELIKTNELSKAFENTACEEVLAIFEEWPDFTVKTFLKRHGGDFDTHPRPSADPC